MIELATVADDCFVRFVAGETIDEARAHAAADLDRGYSYDGYLSFPTRDDAEAHALEFGVEYEIVDAHFGWAFRLGGLCGYQRDRSVDITDLPYAANYSFAALYRGDLVAPIYDGDLFRPRELIAVVKVSEREE